MARVAAWRVADGRRLRSFRAGLLFSSAGALSRTLPQPEQSRYIGPGLTDRVADERGSEESFAGAGCEGLSESEESPAARRETTPSSVAGRW